MFILQGRDGGEGLELQGLNSLRHWLPGSSGEDGLSQQGALKEEEVPMDCSPLGSSVHGALQAKILEWIAISFSKGSS